MYLTECWICLDGRVMNRMETLSWTTADGQKPGLDSLDSLGEVRRRPEYDGSFVGSESNNQGRKFWRCFTGRFVDVREVCWSGAMSCQYMMLMHQTEK